MLRERIFTEYYRGVQLSFDSITRYDIDLRKGVYPVFEANLVNKRKFNIGGLSFRYMSYDHSKAHTERVPDMCLKRDAFHISGVYVTDILNSKIAYGDVHTTNDAIILLISEDSRTIEIFIARGKKNDVKLLFSAVKNGELNNEMESLRLEAVNIFKGVVTDSVTQTKLF
jgi:hypothetical protein